MFNKELLLKIMDEKEFSAYKLWKVSGVAQSTISSILSGNNLNPTTATLEKLANALGVSINTFFESNESTNEKIEIKPTDDAIVKIERARSKMSEDDKKNMMTVLEAAFGKYFKD